MFKNAVSAIMCSKCFSLKVDSFLAESEAFTAIHTGCTNASSNLRKCSAPVTHATVPAHEIC